jgi:hypothetical protein
MSIRRLFWLGAAVLFSIAALVAIAAVLSGSFGNTELKVLETCGIAFVCCGTALAGFACLDRGVIPLLGWITIAIGVTSFAVWTFGAWRDTDNDEFWKVAGVFAVWTIAALIVTTLRLLASSPRLLSTVVPATWVTTVLAAAVSTEMILAEDDGPWKLLVVLLILTGLGYALTPALQRFWAAAEPAPSAERLLGTLGDVDVFAVRGDGRSVTIGSSRTPLSSSEGIVLRERASS